MYILPAGLMRTHGSTDAAVIPAGMTGSRPWMATLSSPPIVSDPDSNLLPGIKTAEGVVCFHPRALLT
jgi:hypothetical protein